VALGAIARYFFERETAGRSVPVLAVGGAAGKTTTKTLAHAAVSALFGETLVTAGNLNNRIGVPMTLLTLRPEHRAVVLEHGTSERGEIAALAAISKPDVGLVVNVGVEHSEGLGSVEEIADEEATLLLAARRAAVTLGDEPLLVARAERATARPIFFGQGANAGVRVTERSVASDGTATVGLRVSAAALGFGEDRSIRPSTRLLGEHAALNLAAATAATLALLGRPATAGELEAMCLALGSVEAVPGRLRPLAIGSRLVIDDSYNSNPRSVAAALAAAREIADRRGSRLVLALGDMLELGPLSATEHVHLVEAADAAGAAQLLFVGAETGRAVTSLAETLRTPYRSFSRSTEAAAVVGDAIEPGDVILVKGSRGMRMERIIEAIEAIEAIENMEKQA
jgi:UDP-N-acetylmuramoyl-tripeptide--D-alanyl-D-alanine ligase